MANRFEQVDEVVDDAITVILEQRGDGQWATVDLPEERQRVARRGPDERAGSAEGCAVRRRQARQ